MWKTTEELTSMEEDLIKGQKEMTNMMAKLFVFMKKSMPPIVSASVIDLEANNENVMAPTYVEGSMGVVRVLIGL